MSSNILKLRCKPCLDAFGLTLASENDANAALRILKDDEASLVVKARCNQDGTIEEFVLKSTPSSIYREPASSLAIEKLLACNKHGIIIPTRRLAVSGKYIHIAPEFSAAQKTIWSVATFEPNAPSFDWLQSPASWTASHTYSAGALLAKTHDATRSFKNKLSESGCAIETSITSRVPQLLLDAFDGANANHLTRIGFENRDHQKLIAIVCKAALEIEDGIHAKALKDEEVIVHGDFQPGNVLYREGQACGLIDWDYARLDSPLMDLAYGLIMYAGNLSSEEAMPFDTNLSVKFLQGYADQITKQGSKLACMPDCYFTPSSTDNRIFSNYMKLSGALIMLWSLGEQGQKHCNGVRVARRTLQLIHSL